MRLRKENKKICSESECDKPASKIKDTGFLALCIKHSEKFVSEIGRKRLFKKAGHVNIGYTGNSLTRYLKDKANNRKNDSTEK
jgi:hypothetical protein